MSLFRRGAGRTDHTLCGPECRYWELYESAQLTLSDLAAQQAGVLGRVGRLRDGFIQLMKSTRPLEFSKAEAALGTRVQRSDDETLLSLAAALFAPDRYTHTKVEGLTELRRALRAAGVHIPEGHDLSTWAAAIDAAGLSVALPLTALPLEGFGEAPAESGLAGLADWLDGEAATPTPDPAVVADEQRQRERRLRRTAGSRRAPAPPRPPASRTVPAQAPDSAEFTPAAGAEDPFGELFTLIEDAQSPGSVTPSAGGEEFVDPFAALAVDLVEAAAPEAGAFVDPFADLAPSAVPQSSSPAQPSAPSAGTARPAVPLAPSGRAEMSPSPAAPGRAQPDLGAGLAPVWTPQPAPGAGPAPRLRQVAPPPADLRVAPSRRLDSQTPQVAPEAAGPQPTDPGPVFPVVEIPTAAGSATEAATPPASPHTPPAPIPGRGPALRRVREHTPVRPQLFPAADSRRAGRGPAKQVRTRATAAVDVAFDVAPAAGELGIAEISAETQKKILSLVCIPRPVFVSELAAVAGGADVADAWEQACLADLAHSPVRLIPAKPRHRLRGSLVLPNRELREGTDFANSWWSQMMDEFRGARLYELGVLLNRVGGQVVNHRITPSTVILWLNQPRGLVGVVVSLNPDTSAGSAGRAEVLAGVEELLRARLSMLAVLTVTDPGLPALVEALQEEAAARKWNPAFPVVAGRSWEFAGDNGTSSTLIVGG